MNVILGQLKYPVLPSMQMSTGTPFFVVMEPEP